MADYGTTLGSEYTSAFQANQRRLAQMMAIYDEIINRYRPGGAFEASSLQQLEKQKTREVGAETQQLISSGLYGTSVTAGLGRKFEEEVGAPARLKLEDVMMQRLSAAQLGKAGAIERVEDVYPSMSFAGGYGGAQTAPTRTYGAHYGEASFPDMFGGYGTLGQSVAPTTGGTGQRVTRESAGLPPKMGAVLAGGGAGTTTSTPSSKTPTIPEYLQQHGVNPNATDPASIAKAKRLQQQWANMYMRR